MSKNDWKSRLNVVYSTNPDFSYETDDEDEVIETLDKEKQNIRVYLDRSHRNGKTVTLVKGFVGTEDDLKDLAKLLKTKCGVGGSVKDGEIIIQGDFRTKLVDILLKEGYKKSKTGN